MPQDTADALARAYIFLRRVEHRIQYLDDQQTHILPTEDVDLDWIAQSMGYSGCCAFLTELDAHRGPDTFCQAQVGVCVEQDQRQRQSSP